MLDVSTQTESMTLSGGHPSHEDRWAMQMRFLTILEVADAMKVSDSTVRRLIKRGLIAAYRVGDRGQLRVKERDLEAYIESQRVRVVSQARSRERLESSE